MSSKHSVLRLFWGFVILVVLLFSACPPPGSLPAHAEVRPQLDGGYAQSYLNKLYFKYTEEYGTSSLIYRVLNKENQVVLTNATQPVTLTPGNEGYVLDVTGIVNGSDFFILEITNNKKEKWYLRFR